MATRSQTRATTYSAPPRRSPTTRAGVIPLVRRFPALARVERVVLGRFPTPVVSLAALAPHLWLKRDDLCADPLGGNKVRALEFLLAGLKPEQRVVTVGSAGSTHALAVATYGTRLGLHVSVGRWRQEMNPTATLVAARVTRITDDAPVFATPAHAYAWAFLRRARGATWIAAGGSTPTGVLGHVNAGLELVDQIEAGVVQEPSVVVVPLGTGGTAAGLALAFAIAQRNITVVGARVVPWIVGRRAHVRRLADRTARLIEHVAGNGTKLPRVRAEMITVNHDTYGGAYGRETETARAAAAQLRTVSSVALDGTYSAKAFALALELARGGPTLFWLTFDSRTLSATGSPP